MLGDQFGSLALKVARECDTIRVLGDHSGRRDWQVAAANYLHDQYQCVGPIAASCQ